ncbi:MAG: helix-turn-helix domain-containing protein [Cytophagales bacterium]|nr:MAG: helix-turn-helix domain-containing protein [Cytophagales bacterium]
MQQRITQYDGLYGEAQSDAARPGEYLFSERIETRSRLFDWVIQPHTHARLYQVFFVQSGQVTFREATRQRELVSPCILLIPPTALHGLVYSPDVTGRILTLSDTLLENLFPATSVLAPMLHSVQCLTVFSAPYPPNTVSELIGRIDEELFDNQPEKQVMLQAYLQQLFLVFYRLWQQNETGQVATNSQAVRYFRQFQQRVRQAGANRSIAQLADELAITPVHLNRICQIVAGKSASQLVQEQVLNEARKYLTYTSYSVSEIAYLLHFEYPNYFARFFRKHTGQSPTEFRERTLSATS